MQPTYNHAQGPAHPGVSAGPSHSLARGHGLSMGDMAAGGVGLGVFDQDLSFDDSLL